MKEITLRFFTYIGILYLVDSFIKGFDLNSAGAYIFLALLLAVTHVVLEPVIKFFTLPINLVTFGIFNFIISCLYLYFFNLFIPGFNLVDGSVGPIISDSIQIPQINMSLIAIIIFSSILLTLLNNVITWASSHGKKK